MTTINYKINNQTGKDLLSTDWESAKILQAATQAEEIKQFGWWNITAYIINNDGSVTMCIINDAGIPGQIDENGNFVPYIDTTVSA
jgi:hypothetical protein